MNKGSPEKQKSKTTATASISRRRKFKRLAQNRSITLVCVTLFCYISSNFSEIWGNLFQFRNRCSIEPPPSGSGWLVGWPLPPGVSPSLAGGFTFENYFLTFYITDALAEKSAFGSLHIHRVGKVLLDIAVQLDLIRTSHCELLSFKPYQNIFWQKKIRQFLHSCCRHFPGSRICHDTVSELRTHDRDSQRLFLTVQ